ncbi:MAG: MBL fold metallo-hydrolase [Verrucomicrobiae bacterium]|nr:MBL fold metallo-hydrolase [Verrucomicrobiae bacterium]
MKITILGSAAAEGWPALFCECSPCAEARRRGGRNIRRRTVYWINRDTLVDFGPDIHWQTSQFGVDLAEIRRIFFTHSHSDHLSTIEICWRRKGFSRVTRPLTLYGSPQLFEQLRGAFEKVHLESYDCSALGIQEEAMIPGQAAEAGGLKVTALAADHGRESEQCLNYVIEENGRTAVIGNDTGWWPDPTWDQIRKFKLDAAILDCTCLHGSPDARRGHMGANTVIAVKKRLGELGVLKPGAQVVANHFSHNGMTLHEELCEFFRPHGIAVGYDGMVIDV